MKCPLFGHARRRHPHGFQACERPPCQLTTLAVKPAGTGRPLIHTRTVATATLAVALNAHDIKDLRAFVDELSVE
jgi:hypothetical protein